MSDQQVAIIDGKQMGSRVESRLVEEALQTAVAQGHNRLQIKACGQHGLGGRLWREDKAPIFITIEGPSGQRLGSMGFPGTHIDAHGPASDDVGWLNAGAEITIHGNAGNGVGNGMAQGSIAIAGSIGARGMTMTKQNPRFDPPELWVLGSVGDYFGEFMAGGIAVVCGHDAQSPDNVLGYRPFVGMVGGKVFFRGPHKGFSQADAKVLPISDTDWAWMETHLAAFLKRVRREELLPALHERDAWQMLVARTPHEKVSQKRLSMSAFHATVWNAELGAGGLIGDLTDLDRSPIPLVPTGDMRRFVPLWENRKYAAPCEATCPTGIPVHDRWRLIREGRVDEAADLALAYTPFPATVCGYLCSNPCMEACTRHSNFMVPVDTAAIGKASLTATLPPMPEPSGRRIAVIGGGPAGISTAWQLRQQGHEATVFDMATVLGGKITSAIPGSRIPAEVVETELARIRKVIPHVNLQQRLTEKEFIQLREDYDAIVVAVGAGKPRSLPVPGNKRLVPALDFLNDAKAGSAAVGKTVVIIGAGNVGCDVATEAHRLGAEHIVLIDIQAPASFGKEREAAEAVGATFRWPCFTKEITPKGVLLTSGELLPADTVVVSIGDAPDIDFLPETIARERGFVTVDAFGQTSDPKVFAIGDAVKPGLITDAIGSGRKAAAAIDDILSGRRPSWDLRQMIDRNRITLEYFDPRVTEYEGVAHCGSQCSSCGACRDCGICVAVCPQAAIRRQEKDDTTGYEYVVDPDRCIGCGFCAGACPCGIWDLVENTPIG